MTSSMMSGDRRWAATRKSGMTVLGKVPKPINLPSQRLENHGLDPNVEIVPKGTLTWGSRPSSASPNAWSSSAQSSPNADGSIGSPSFLSGRPSSGGNGRPSTAGSDKSFESANNARTSNSRPSSASGALTPNQSSSMARPRSAESRPGSSQLSRFAQTVHENVRMGTMPSNANDFTLSSGDFPTLGSEKNSDMHMHAGVSSQGHPSSSHSGVGGQKERLEVCPSDVAIDMHSDKGSSNAGKMDTPPYAGADVIMSSDTDDWHREPQIVQPYPNMNLSQPHFNAWHGPPVHTPDGVWYRGVPPGVPYRPMGPPGNYHMEPFAYYPQLPARPVPNSQSAPRAGAILGGYPHKNGELLCPRMASDSYMGTPAPVIPIRPGVYPGQLASYDGYYGPRPTLESAGGLTTGHGNYNHHQNQNAPRESGGSYAQSNAFLGSGANHASEASHAHETHGGQYRVLLKPHGGHVINDANQNRDNSSVGSVPHMGPPTQYFVMTNDGDRAANNRGDNVEVVDKSLDSTVNVLEGCVRASSMASLPESSSKDRGVDDHHIKTSATVTSADLQQRSNKRDIILIGQEECTDIRPPVTHGSNVGPLASGNNRRRMQSEYMKVDCLTASGNSHAGTSGDVSVSVEKGPTNAFSFKVVPPESFVEEKVVPHSTNVKVISPSVEPLHSAIAVSDHRGVGPKVHSSAQKNAHGTHTANQFHEKSRSNNYNGDQWRKQSPRNDPSHLNTKNILSVTNPQFCQTSEELPNQRVLQEPIIVGDVKALVDQGNVQRVQKNEAMALRAKQLQMAEEERERIKEQKAKALAKLEELNRRTLKESSSKNRNQVSLPYDSSQKIEDDSLVPASASDAVNDDSLVPPSASDAVVQTSSGTCDCESSSRETVQESGTIISTREDLVKPEELALGQTSMHISNEPGGGFKQLPTSDVGNKSGIPTVGKQNLGDSGIDKPDVSREKSQSNAHTTSSDSSLSSDHSRSITSRRTKFQENTISKQRQMGDKRRQGIQQVKKLGEMAVSPVSKNDPHVPQQCASGSLSITNNFGYNSKEAGDVTMQTNKKNDGNICYNNTADEVTPVSSFPSKHDKGILENPNNITRKPLELICKSTSAAVQASQDSTEDQSSTSAFAPSSQNSFPGDNGHGKPINQWKPLPPRRTRNLQSRSTDKSKGTEVVWAPVKPLNKSEPVEGVGSDTTLEVDIQSMSKNETDIQTNLKFKRAEMERYVPKVVAKELTRHASTVLHSGGTHKMGPAETHLDLVATKSMSSTDASGTRVKNLEMTSEVKKNGDLERPYKNNKSRISWRQRNSHKGAPSSDVSETIQQSSDARKTDIGAPNAQSTHPSHDLNACNSSVLSEEPAEVTSIEQVIASRGKHHAYKANNVPETKDRISDTYSQVLELNDDFSGKSFAKRESRDIREPRNISEHARSHWKPKSQVYSSDCCQDRSFEGQSVSHVGSIGNDSVYRQDRDNLRFRDFEDTSILTHATVTLEARKIVAQDASIESNHTTGSSRDHNDLPHQEVFQMGEEDHGGGDLGSASGSHSRAKHTDQFKKGHVNSHVGGRGFSHVAGKHHLSASGDRSRHIPRSGYQKVELQNKTTESGGTNIAVNEEPKDSFHASGPSYRERSQNHIRRGGNFYTRHAEPSRSVVGHDGRG